MIDIATFPVEKPDGFVDGVEAVINAISLASDRPHEILTDEEADDVTLPIERQPELTIVDDAGRTFTAARLQREPGTTRFTIVLTTTEDIQ
ncbi:hypothetical protein FHS31_000804 [Sphingomonas vulcanisoli]|uniref:Uncharacterized protein n=1 Tax=Sphingomonas vulcanisoli TaxID=1658060 RepID=A0ABX0TNV1_9SPHN|nr:hypothetical protein [Sphingomonas vulcanisoli]NIJ07208.1 hypothetical protein [Sphingomonas vulcanisoli]